LMCSVCSINTSIFNHQQTNVISKCAAEWKLKRIQLTVTTYAWKQWNHLALLKSHCALAHQPPSRNNARFLLPHKCWKVTDNSAWCLERCLCHSNFSVDQEALEKPGKKHSCFPVLQFAKALHTTAVCLWENGSN
jgi:hypothetical protein